MNINKALINSVSSINSKSISTKNTSVKQEGISKDFQTYVKNNASAQSQSSPQISRDRVDKIEISYTTPHSSSAFEISQLKNKILTDLQQETNAQKIQAIADKVNNNTYEIDPSEIAKIILKI